MAWLLSLFYYVFVGYWLQTLFRSGPAWLGFWKGLGEGDICARLTKTTEALDWYDGRGDVLPACTRMIEREYGSFVVMVHLCLYLALIYYVITSVRSSYLLKKQAKELAKAFATEWSALQDVPACTKGHKPGSNREQDSASTYRDRDEDRAIA